MKKLLGLILLIIILVVSFIFYSNRSKDYILKYTFNDYDIIETFSKEDNIYSFNISKNDLKYDFSYYSDYRKDRKIITNIDIKEVKDYECLSIKAINYKSKYICYDGVNYVDEYYANISKAKENSKIKDNNKISIYDKKNDYFIWNGHGLTNVLNNKTYNFIDKEIYDNNLAYRFENNLIIADYDQQREFNKFYIFNYESKKVIDFNFDYKISFNSYFMGDYDNYIYLFDQKNKTQYKIDIIKKKITVSSNLESAFIYNDKEDKIGINKLVYNEILFSKENLINFEIKNNNLYYRYKSSNIKVLINDKITDIVYVDRNNVYYLKDNNLYKYNIYDGSTLLLNYFEWNFSYKNKIFIF